VAAARLAQEAEVTSGKVYNLLGGMSAWSGKTLAGFPKVRVFDTARDFADLLYTAMDLEKGAWRFYDAVLARFPQAPHRMLFEQLSTAETAHARAVYAYWRAQQPAAPAFEDLFVRLKGEILEGGESLADMLGRLDSLAGDTCLNLIEIALHIEAAAFDLYRTVADRSSEAAARDALLAIAQAEKGHMRTLTRGIPLCRP